jgi:excisionase family DNA binding protein
MHSARDVSAHHRQISLASPLLTAGEVAGLLGGVPAKTVLQLAREGRLPSVRIGRHVRFVRGELEGAIEMRRVI